MTQVPNLALPLSGEMRRGFPAEMLSVGFVFELFLLVCVRYTLSFPLDDDVEMVAPYPSCPTP